MKRILPCSILLLSFASLCSSCAEEDIAEIENKVTYKFYTSAPGQSVKLQQCVGSRTPLNVTTNWERTAITKAKYAVMEASCEEPNTLLTCEIYVNNKLKVKKQRNKWIRISVTLK